jgi:hypothetical protein
MSADICQLSVLMYANGFTHWVYQEAPAKALAPGFFDPVADLLTVSDLITITKDGLAAIAVVVDKTEPVILRALMS